MQKLTKYNIADYLKIGVITSTHGVSGEVRVVPLTEYPSRFEGLEEAQLEIGGKLYDISIESSRQRNNDIIIKFSGMDNKDQSQQLKGSYISVHRSKAVRLKEGEYFIFDIVGCEVYDMKTGYAGKVTDVLKTGSNDVYVVRDENTGREILIPALKSVIASISVSEKKIVVSIPEGLVD